MPYAKPKHADLFKHSTEELKYIYSSANRTEKGIITKILKERAGVYSSSTQSVAQRRANVFNRLKGSTSFAITSMKGTQNELVHLMEQSILDNADEYQAAKHILDEVTHLRKLLYIFSIELSKTHASLMHQSKEK